MWCGRMWRMRRIVWLVIFLVSATLARAETGKDAINALQQSMANEQLVLRNFSGEDVVRAGWTGSAFELEAPRWRTMGVLSVKAVRLNRDVLRIECIRHVAVRDKTDRIVLYPSTDPVRIDVDLKGGDLNEVLPRVKDALFYQSIQDALEGLPQDVRKVIPARIDKRMAPKGSAKVDPLCDCASKDKTACTAGLRAAGMQPPKYLGGDDPQYTDEARSSGLNGYVNVLLKVDEKGQPEDVWVAVPLGMGLDEEAARSVLTYVLKPAKCHGTPVTVALEVEVRFQTN